VLSDLCEYAAALGERGGAGGMTDPVGDAWRLLDRHSAALDTVALDVLHILEPTTKARER
jgi:hypothetical protein